ncbi:MAG: flagellar hook-length control protein FliK [Clostridiales bacterium]|nr:flagellar hook-length control protein FliK [Clostridiales bacterium]
MLNSVQNAAVLPMQNRGGNRGNRGVGGGDFDSLMSNLGAASNAEAATRPENNAPVQRNNNPQGSNENQQNTPVAETQNSQNSTNYAPQETETAQNYEATAEYAPAPEAISAEALPTEIIVDEDALLAELAATLGITLEALAELIETLEMPLEELLVAENRVELLLAAKGLENQVQLLNYPEALPTLQKLAQTVETYTTVGSYNPVVQEELSLEAELPAELPEEALTAQTATDRRDAPTTEAPEPTAQIMPEVAEELVRSTAQTTIQNEAQPQMTPATQTAPAPTVATTTQTTAPAPFIPLQNITPANIVDQIVQNVRFISGEQMAEIRIMLKPEQLGDLSMRIATQNGIVTAQFIADSQRVKELIEAGFELLRDALEQAGINISDIEVNVRNEGGYHDFENETISEERIRNLMTQGLEDAEAELPQATEENLVDYRI